jgi:hypothetical protein
MKLYLKLTSITIVILKGMKTIFLMYLILRMMNNKVIVEIKGRRIPSTQYKETIITASKVTNGFMKIDEGYKVYFVFVFTDKVMEIELKEDVEFQCKFTGTNSIAHYLIPIDSLTEIEEDSVEELENAD